MEFAKPRRSNVKNSTLCDRRPDEAHFEVNEIQLSQVEGIEQDL
jgi:hypothetical protein